MASLWRSSFKEFFNFKDEKKFTSSDKHYEISYENITDLTFWTTQIWTMLQIRTWTRSFNGKSSTQSLFRGRLSKAKSSERSNSGTEENKLGLYLDLDPEQRMLYVSKHLSLGLFTFASIVPTRSSVSSSRSSLSTFI